MKYSRIFFTKLAFVLVAVSFLEFNPRNLHAFQAYPHNELTDKVDALFAQWDNKDSPGAAVGIFKDGRIIYARGYGSANLEYSIPNTPHTVFRIGSTSKHFTAMCIALLIERKKLSVRDDIRLYIPELPDYGPAITIANMLHHTSGFRNYEALMELAGRDGDTIKVPFYTDQDAIDMIVRQKKLNFSPGERLFRFS
jgi:CubicO group peptidase (beta-lactamase class C family)